MDLEKFLENFINLFDDTDASEIRVDTQFHDLEEWSSLVGMSVMAMAKTQYGKTVTGKEMKTCKTVEDLYHLIAEK